MSDRNKRQSSSTTEELNQGNPKRRRSDTLSSPPAQRSPPRTSSNSRKELTSSTDLSRTSTSSSATVVNNDHHSTGGGSHNYMGEYDESKEPGTIGGRPVRIYADGIYDLFHFGHARSLEQAKKIFPNTYLLVGVCNDQLTHKLKGKTVMADHERAESLRHCRWVDQVIENAPWIVTQDFIDKHNIDYVAHGEDICLDENGVDIYKFVKDQGKYQTIKRTEGISTSDIILRIVKNYDSYVRRNLARGYTGKQLGIGFVKENQLKMSNQIQKMKENVEERMKKLKEWGNDHHITSFLKKFGGNMEKLIAPFRDEYSFSDSDSDVARSPIQEEDGDDDDDEIASA
eukprot:TRINITY_DN1834_c0_g1_i1.p1 TRINITY_DN1834_c0_g1~~TRINITY_DN1834_c0_g1_i1.p1  ORF type:complete len:343 (-),score=108.29 TRINITY_DN1834_c0_g1_i1:75-1103(-)